MKNVKKTSVKKYKAGGASSTVNPGKRAKKIENLQAKKTALDNQIKEDAPYGHGEAWVGMTPKSQRLGKRIAKLESKPQAKSGGSVAKMKSGGMVKKYQPGGPTKKNPKSYSEADFSNGSQMETTVQGPNNYKKQIRWEGAGTGNSSKKPYTMTVTKGGKTNTFKLSEEQAKNQRTIAKKEAGQKKKMGGSVAKMKVGGTAKPKAMYGKTVKPTMMKKGGTTKKK